MKTKLNLIFDLFTNTDELRPVMLKPFELNNKIYATDGFTMIRINKNDCDFEINNELKPPNCEAVIPEENMNIILNFNKEMFEQYKTEDEYTYIDKDIKCPTCYGSGEVEWEFENYTKDDDCPVCDGTGISEHKEPVKTGNKIFKQLYIKLFDCYFDIYKFYRLIEVYKYFGGDIVLTSQINSNTANLFKIGKCEILIMPIASETVDKNAIIDISNNQ